MNKGDIVKQQSDFILYTGNDGKVELEMDSTVRKFRTVQAEGSRQVELYDSATAEDFSVVQISVI